MKRIFPIGIGICALIAPATAEVSFEVVARVGDAVSDIPGATVATLQEATINHRGDVAFAARVSGGGVPIYGTNVVLFSGDDGLKSVLVSGENLPGGSEIAGIVNAPVIVNAAGQVLIRSATTAGAALLVADVEGAAAVALDGLVPEEATGAEFSLASFGASDLALTDSGDAVFRAILTGGAISNSNNESLWRASGTSLLQIAREGGISPAGSEVGYGFSASPLQFQPVMTSRSGVLAYTSPLSGAAVTNGNDQALFTSGFDGARVLVREGEAAIALGLPGNATHRPDLTANRAINAAGDVVFVSTLVGTGINTTNDYSVWLASPDGPSTMLLREGQTLPNLPFDVQMSSLPFTQFPQHVGINSDGEVVLTVMLKGLVAAANDSALYAQVGGDPHIIFREGDLVPGLGGVLFGSAVSARHAINRYGEIAIFAPLTGPGVNSSNNESLWLWSEATGLEMIAREGSVLPLVGGLTPVLGTSLTPDHSLGDDSANGIWFNNRGEWVFKTLLDGQDALVKASIQRVGMAELTHVGWTSGVTRTSAGIYQADFSSDPLGGGTASGGNVDVSYGFAGQVTIPIGLVAQGLPMSLAEMTGAAPELALEFDDGSLAAVESPFVSWWVDSGSATFFAEIGSLVAGPVFQDETVWLNYALGGYVGSSTLAVTDSVADNFGTYAGDGLDDDWQVLWFGLPPAWSAAPNANPDSDAYDNRFESLTGTNPTDGSDFLTVYLDEFGGGSATLRLSKMIPGTRYGVRRSVLLGDANDWPEIMALETPFEIENEPLIDPDAPADRAFYRIEPTPVAP